MLEGVTNMLNVSIKMVTYYSLFRLFKYSTQNAHWFLEPGYGFDKESLAEYNHMSFGGPPVTVNTLEEADELLLHDQKESEIGKFI